MDSRDHAIFGRFAPGEYAHPRDGRGGPLR